MSGRLRTILIWVGYPVIYLGSLVLFLIFTFPFEALRERVEAEANAAQASSGRRVTIESLDGYWLTGVEARGVRIISPPSNDGDGEAATDDGKKGDAGKGKKKGRPRPRVTTIDHVFVSYSVLGSLFSEGRTVNFGAEVGGGYIGGYIQDSEKLRKVVIDLEEVDASTVPYLGAMVGLPLRGSLSGKVDLIAPARRLSKADGTVQLTVSNLVIGDGKAKLKASKAMSITVPPIRGGELRLTAEFKSGKVSVKELSLKGKDIDFAAEGSLRLRDKIQYATADLRLQFKFSDAYKNKNDMTRGLFDALKFMPDMKRALGQDGFYRFRLAGPIARPRFRPSPMPRGGAKKKP